MLNMQKIKSLIVMSKMFVIMNPLNGCSSPVGGSLMHGSSNRPAAASACRVLEFSSGPKIYDCSGTDNALRVTELVERARDGLGFPEREGPRAGDFMFVGKYYLAWIDNTGFSGKLNGLWALNADVEQLDFVLAEPTPSGARPVSMLLPGEDGDGRWPRAYNGAEHYELPRFKNGRHDSQAGIREANHFTDAPAWWRECINTNDDPARWDTAVGTTNVSLGDGQVSFRNESPLTIVARFHADSYPCGSPFPVSESDTTDLRLMSGYTMYGDSPVIERRYQMVNAGDHAVANVGMEKLIGGQILTDWPYPHYLKQYQNFVAWDGADLEKFAPIPHSGQGQKSDFIRVRGTGSLTISAEASAGAGRSMTMNQQVENSGEDFGICLCIAHGGFEFTGSVLAGQNIPAKVGNENSYGPEQLRTLIVGGSRAGASLAQVSTKTINSDDESEGIHEVGRRDDRGWTAVAGQDLAGFMLYKKYLSLKARSVGQVVFYLEANAELASNEPLFEIDLVLNGKQVLKKKIIKSGDFFDLNKNQRFVIDFEAPEVGRIEPRVRWLGRGSVTLDSVVINSI